MTGNKESTFSRAGREKGRIQMHATTDPDLRLLRHVQSELKIHRFLEPESLRIASGEMEANQQAMR